MYLMKLATMLTCVAMVSVCSDVGFTANLFALCFSKFYCFMISFIYMYGSIVVFIRLAHIAAAQNMR